MIHIVIADDHAMVREGLRGWIEQESDMKVVAEAATAADVLNLCREYRADVLLQDLQMPDRNGLEIIRQLTSEGNSVRILAFSGLDKQNARAAIEAGAHGYLSKEERRGVVMEAIRWAASRAPGVWLSPLTANAVTQVTSAVEKYRLTGTELKILHLLKLSNEEIANNLFISLGTVKNHVSSIYGKLGLHSRQQAIEWAERNGFILSSTNSFRPQ